MKGELKVNLFEGKIQVNRQLKMKNSNQLTIENGELNMM